LGTVARALNGKAALAAAAADNVKNVRRCIYWPLGGSIRWTMRRCRYEG
jgi:hypothetical protein